MKPSFELNCHQSQEAQKRDRLRHRQGPHPLKEQTVSLLGVLRRLLGGEVVPSDEMPDQPSDVWDWAEDVMGLCLTPTSGGWRLSEPVRQSCRKPRTGLFLHFWWTGWSEGLSQSESRYCGLSHLESLVASEEDLCATSGARPIPDLDTALLFWGTARESFSRDVGSWRGPDGRRRAQPDTLTGPPVGPWDEHWIIPADMAFLGIASSNEVVLKACHEAGVACIPVSPSTLSEGLRDGRYVADPRFGVVESDDPDSHSIRVEQEAN
jgi:hypothetical protein